MTLTVKSFAHARDGKPDLLDREDRSSVVAVVVEYLRLWAQEAFIDGEYLAEAGSWVGSSRHQDIDTAVLAVLRSEPTSPLQQAISPFLDGYWCRRSISDSFDLKAYMAGLDTLPPSDRAYAATALALYSALCSTTSRLNTAQQAAIRSALLVARGKLLALNLFPHVLSSLNYLVAPGQSRPVVDAGGYRAYRCDEGPLAYLVVERVVDGQDVLHVHDLALHDRKLEVPYEMRNPRHTDADAQELIATCILASLLEDRFRGQADIVDYVNITSKMTRTLPYFVKR